MSVGPILVSGGRGHTFENPGVINPRKNFENHGVTSSVNKDGPLFAISSDGTKAFRSNGWNSMVDMTLSTAYDPSSRTERASLTINSAIAGLTSDHPRPKFFAPNGKRLYAGNSNGTIHQLDFTTAWDASTNNDPGKPYDISGGGARSVGVTDALGISHDGTHLYHYSNPDGFLYQNDLYHQYEPVDNPALQDDQLR